MCRGSGATWDSEYMSKQRKKPKFCALLGTNMKNFFFHLGVALVVGAVYLRTSPGAGQMEVKDTRDGKWLTN